MKSLQIVCLIIFGLSISVNAQEKVKETEPVRLEAYKRIDKSARDEVSGIIKSRYLENVYWVHGDSGTEDRIYAINSDGEIVSDLDDYEGTKLLGAKNKDWEDIANGPDSTLIIADLGNNCQCRNDLKVFIIKEPSPDAEEIQVLKEYEVAFPKPDRIIGLLFDNIPNTEAIFVKNGALYSISKEPRTATLFKLDDPKPDSVNVFEEVDSFRFRELVTAADISPDESRLAVLTYRSVWIFELVDQIKLFQNPVIKIPIRGTEQVESIAFSGDTLIIAEENGDLYRIDIPE